MSPVIRSLEEISTGHAVFERDQVLTHDQLNSLAAYADDQGRLTRTHLLGVGVVCGLRVSLDGGGVTATRGFGVTTDGDLLHLDRDTVYDRFRSYDESYPAYAPLFAGGDVNGERLPAFELLPRGTREARAQPLSGFAGGARGLADTAALLLMESWVRDDDLCSGTDCDNQGREAMHTPRLLLLPRAEAAALRESLRTAAAAFAALEPVVAERPAFTAAITSPARLADVYRAACDVTQQRLEAALARLPAAAEPVLGDVVGAATVRGWVGRLAAIRNGFANAGANIQYHYDFLKDVADAYNELRERLFDDHTLCVPPPEAFPKHLLLGDLAPGADPAANRTGFYPSPLVGRGAGERDHARFLARRLDAMLQRFAVPSPRDAPIRITPSTGEDRPLDDRAIPFYYAPGGADPIHRRWSYRLARRGMEEHNYSYHADGYGARGGAANPLGTQIGRFGFFRVEGHVGRPVAEAVAAIEAEIRARNLPFAVRSVFLGTQRQRVVRRPGVRFTDLHHFHHLIRRDIAVQLDEVQRFSANFRLRVDNAVRDQVVEDVDESQGISLRQVAQDSDTGVRTMAQAVAAPMQMSYAEYRAAPPWTQNVNSLLRTAGQFKSQLGPVVKTEFSTPFDTLIGSRQLEWLPWLDEILKAREEKDDERLLFRRFLEEHPGVEHFAGVCRGGTLVLAYDDAGAVVADFTLAYHAPEPEREPVEPALPAPGVRPPYVVDEGVRIIPPRTKFFRDRIFDFERTILEPKLQQNLRLQTQYLDVFKDSYLNVFKDSLNVIKNVDPRLVPGTVGPFQDPNLGMLVEQNALSRQRLETLVDHAGRPDLDPGQKRFLEGQVLAAQEDLARGTQRIADYVSEGQVEVRAGSEGFNAILQVSESMSLISETKVRESTQKSLNSVMETTKNAGLKTMLGGVLRL
jgi:hypothetical protein